MLSLPAGDDRAARANALWHACRGGQRPVVEYLIEHGANPNWIGYDGKTPLDAARQSGASELVQWLEGHIARGSRSG